MVEVQIEVEDGGAAVKLRAESSPELRAAVAALKRWLPPYRRRYEAGARRWIVKRSGRGQLRRWLRDLQNRAGLVVEVIDTAGWTSSG